MNSTCSHCHRLRQDAAYRVLSGQVKVPPNYPGRNHPIKLGREIVGPIPDSSAYIRLKQRSFTQLNPAAPGVRKGTSCHNRYGVPISRWGFYSRFLESAPEWDARNRGNAAEPV